MPLTPFERRLVFTLSVFFVVQAVFLLILQFFFPVIAPWFAAFFPCSVVYHVLVWIVMMSVRKHFVLLDGSPMVKVGIPNLLTILRLSSLPTIVLLFLLARHHGELSVPLVAFVTFAFLTDLFDGFLARTFKMGSRLGQMLDSSSDYLILATLTVILGITGVLPLWLLALILVRLFSQIFAALYFAIVLQEQVLEATFWGKASLFALMVLYAVEILVFLKLTGLAEHWSVFVVQIVTAVLMVVSLVDKVVFFARKIQEKKNSVPGKTH